jgi:hypothetical protein
MANCCAAILISTVVMGGPTSSNWRKARAVATRLAGAQNFWSSRGPQGRREPPKNQLR